MSHSVCGGPSEARAGFNSAVVNTAAGIEGLLIHFLPPPIAGAVSAIVAADTFELTSFCLVDPPPDPGFTAADYLALLDPADLGAYLTARAKVMQWWEHIYWYQACQCVSSTTPPLPTPSTPGQGSQNPGLPSGGLSVCWQRQSAFSQTAPTGVNSYFDLTASLLWEGTTLAVTTSSGLVAPFSHTAVALPPNVTSLNSTTQNVGATLTPPKTATTGYLGFWNSAGVELGQQEFMYGQGAPIGPFTPDIPLPPNTAYVSAILEIGYDTETAGRLMSWTISLQANCPGAGLESPCCPPDPSVDLRLNQILTIVANLTISSGTSPFTSWRDGIRHSSLRDSGRFQLADGVVGVRAEVTTLPPGLQVDPGDPTFYWNMGFVTPLALDVPLRGQRLVFNPESFALPQVADGVAYDLRSGGVMDLVELLPVAPSA